MVKQDCNWFPKTLFGSTHTLNQSCWWQTEDNCDVGKKNRSKNYFALFVCLISSLVFVNPTSYTVGTIVKLDKFIQNGLINFILWCVWGKFNSKVNFAMFFVLLILPRRCSSYVGRTGRRQDITLARGCWTRGIVAHEIGECKLNILRIQNNLK